MYQKRLKSSQTVKNLLKHTGKWVVMLSVLAFISYGIVVCTNQLMRSLNPFEKIHSAFFASPAPDQVQNKWLHKKDIRPILQNHQWKDYSRKLQPVYDGQSKYYIVPSIDLDLQNYITDKLYTRTSRYIGIVVSDPDTGKIRAMVSLDKTDPDNNVCTNKAFPAASVFKIVSAAAAIETQNFSVNHKFPYNGRSHTLYKSQLKKNTNRYTNWVTFKEAFAKSVNPVFGKIGTFYLKKEELENYAAAFGFNQDIDFELPLIPSQAIVKDHSYHWAEVACGFNKQTLITPLHGATIAGMIINGGVLIEPTIIEKMMDEQAQLIYKARTTYLRRVVSPETAKAIQQMMRATVLYGTSRKSFGSYKKDKVLSRLHIGGKTGSINNRTNDVRFDWFVGYAAEKNTEEKIAVSIVVAHDKYIGTKSSRYARLIIKYYFENLFEQRKNTTVIQEKNLTDRNAAAENG